MVFFLFIPVLVFNVYSVASLAYDTYRVGRRLHKAYKKGLLRPAFKWANRELKKLKKREEELEDKMEEYERLLEKYKDGTLTEEERKRFFLFRCKFPRLRETVEEWAAWFREKATGLFKANPIDKEGWKKEDNVDFVGVLILMGITYLSFLVSIIEIALFLMFYFLYVQDIKNRARMLKSWLVARFFCFIFSICVVALYILAILKTPKGFADEWQLYVGLGVFVLILAFGIVTAVLAILRIHRHNQEVIASQRGSIIPWALLK